MRKKSNKEGKMFKKIKSSIAVFSMVLLCASITAADDSRFSSWMTASSQYDSRYEEPQQETEENYIEEENIESEGHYIDEEPQYIEGEVEEEHEIFEEEGEIIYEEAGIEYEEAPEGGPDSEQYEYIEEPQDEGDLVYEDIEVVEGEFVEEEFVEGEHYGDETASEEYEAGSEEIVEEEPHR